MFRYRSSAVAGLAAQLKRGPVRLRLRQLQAIEFLLSITETSKRYPYEFVCHALTGFRPRNGEAGVASGMIDGELLRDDLVLMAEELSAEAGIEASGIGEPVFSVAELAGRFDVSTKTIFRWHRRGLVGWRFRFDDRRVRLAFPERCVRRFVAENAELVNRGSAFSQLTKAERDAIVRRAAELFESGHKTVNAVAKVLAGEIGRAVETIRLLLKQHDEAHPRAGIFNRSELRVEPNDQRLTVWEAYQDGASVASLAERFDRPVAWVYRTITQMRARELQARPIEFIASDDFLSPDAEAEILGSPVLRCPTGEVTPEKRIPADLPPYLRQLFRLPLLTPEGEVALFRKFNYLKFKADRVRREFDPETVSASELDRVEALLDEAQKVKNQITQANLRLVVSIAKRHVRPGMDLFELISDGNMSLIRAVDKFDFTRGFKFSTYCSWAIMKNFARTVPDQRHYYDRYQTGREELLDALAVSRGDEQDDELIPSLRGVIERMLSSLDERAQAILRQRYGLDGGGEPQTLDQIGRRFGVSKERIRQLEARAMEKLRSEFVAEAEQLLGA